VLIFNYVPIHSSAGEEALIGSAKRCLSKRFEQTTPLQGVLLTRRVMLKRSDKLTESASA